MAEIHTLPVSQCTTSFILALSACCGSISRVNLIWKVIKMGSRCTCWAFCSLGPHCDLIPLEIYCNRIVCPRRGRGLVPGACDGSWWLSRGRVGWRWVIMRAMGRGGWRVMFEGGGGGGGGGVGMGQERTGVVVCWQYGLGQRSKFLTKNKV